MYLNLLVLILGLVSILAFKGVVPILAILIGTIIYRNKKENQKIKVGKEHIGIIIFLIAIGLSFMTSINKDASWTHYNRIIRAMISPIIIYNIIPFKKKYFDYGFILGGVILAFMGISQYFFELIPYNGGDHGRIDGGYGIWHYSYIISFISIYILNLFIMEKEKKVKIILFIISILVIFATLLSNTRSAWLAVVLGIFIILIINKKIKEILVLSTLGIVLLVSLKDNQYVKPYIEKAKTITDVKTNGSNLGRFAIWETAYDIFKENPILGVGISNYDRANDHIYIDKATGKEYKKKYYSAHSDYFGLLAETGIIGFIGFLIMILGLILEAYKRNKLKLIIPVTFVWLFLGIFESNMNKNTYVYVMYFILYSIINYGSDENKE